MVSRIENDMTLKLSFKTRYVVISNIKPLTYFFKPYRLNYKRTFFSDKPPLVLDIYIPGNPPLCIIEWKFYNSGLDFVAVARL